VRTGDVSIPGELGSSGINSSPEDVPDLDELDVACFVSSTPPVGSGCMNYPYLKCCRGKEGSYSVRDVTATVNLLSFE